jgi:hypothetical protein
VGYGVVAYFFVLESNDVSENGGTVFPHSAARAPHHLFQLLEALGALEHHFFPDRRGATPRTFAGVIHWREYWGFKKHFDELKLWRGNEVWVFAETKLNGDAQTHFDGVLGRAGRHAAWGKGMAMVQRAAQPGKRAPRQTMWNAVAGGSGNHQPEASGPS